MFIVARENPQPLMIRLSQLEPNSRGATIFHTEEEVTSLLLLKLIYFVISLVAVTIATHLRSFAPILFLVSLFKGHVTGRNFSLTEPQ